MSKTRKFFILTFVITWLLWLPTVINSQWMDVPSIFLLIGMFASFTPTVIGLIMIKKEKGDQFKHYIVSRVKIGFSVKWLVIMMLFPLQSFLALIIVQKIDANYVVVNPISYIMAPLIFLQILFIGGALGEEFGWRGYAFEKLQNKYGAFMGTLILGLLWSIWHLPLFFMANTVQSNMPIWQFVLQNTTIAFVYTWIYNRTKGNMILMILLHAVLNTSAALFPYWQSDIGRYIGLGSLLIVLICIYIFDKTFLRDSSTT